MLNIHFRQILSTQLSNFAWHRSVINSAVAFRCSNSRQRWPESLFQTPTPLLFQNFWIRVRQLFKFENPTPLQTPAAIIDPTVVYQFFADEMTTQTLATTEMEKWLRIQVRFFTNFDSGSGGERKTQNPAGVDSGYGTTSDSRRWWSSEMSTDQDWIGLNQDWSQFLPDQDWIGLQLFSKLVDQDWIGLRKFLFFNVIILKISKILVVIRFHLVC